MEENVALDSKKQKTFVKSIRGIKKLIKKNEKKSETKKKDVQPQPEKPFSMRLKEGGIKKKKRKERGLVYLSHIPHGFYEHQMTEYFKQFGVVTNARVIRSKRTGNSKGFAFVEFRETSVAQIVAETMNNYLMGKRLIKASYIPPEKQKRRALRKNWNTKHNPTSIKRTKLKKAFNAVKDDAEELKRARKMLTKLNKTKKKLSELGINYEFFAPVDVPGVLLESIVKKETDEDVVKEEIETKPKKGKKQKPAKQENQEVKQEAAPKAIKKGKPLKVNDNQQKEKEKKLKDAGVKSVEEFISLDGNDSDDESCDFDSDEYEKMLAEESSGESGDSGDEQNSVDVDSVDDENDFDDKDNSKEEIKLSKKVKRKSDQKVFQLVQTKKRTQKLPQKQQAKTQAVKAINQVKRKGFEKPAVASMKPKFEKQNQKTLKKQFKKK